MASAPNSLSNLFKDPAAPILQQEADAKVVHSAPKGNKLTEESAKKLITDLVDRSLVHESPILRFVDTSIMTLLKKLKEIPQVREMIDVYKQTMLAKYQNYQPATVTSPKSAQWKTRADEIGLIYDRLQATVRDKAALPKRIEEMREVFGNELVDKITDAFCQDCATKLHAHLLALEMSEIFSEPFKALWSVERESRFRGTSTSSS